MNIAAIQEPDQLIDHQSWGRESALRKGIAN